MIHRALPVAVAAVVLIAPSAPPAFAAATPSLNFQLNAAQIKANCAREIAQFKARSLAVENVPRAQRTFATVVLPLENASADLNDSLAAEGFLAYVAAEKAVRDASNACSDDLSAISSEMGARPGAYEAVADAAKSNTATTAADKKLLEITLTGYKRSGAGLSATDRIEFVKLSTQMGALQNKFEARLAEDVSAIPISQAEAAGLAPSFVATFKKTESGYTVPVNESTAGRFLPQASAPDARQRFFIAYNRRGGDENVKTLGQIIAIRDRLALLLGYPNWAAYQIADHMAQTPQRVDSLLNDLTTRLSPLAKDEQARLAARKVKDTGDSAAVLKAWDTGYYRNQILKSDYAYDSEAVRAYFPADHVIDGVMGIYSRILGVTFKPIDPPNLWSPNLKAFAVADTASGKSVGTLVLDLYPRPGKYDHFANFPMLPGRLVDGTYRPAFAAIVGNFPEAAPGKPATLSRGDVETFFHEFGHSMAALLTTAPYETLSGGFRIDFVEAPSQMLENWTWDRAVLKELSSNVTTGAPLPDALIDKMVATRRFNEASSWLAQIVYAQIDLAYHTAGPKPDTTAIWYREFARTPFPPLPPGLIPQAGFGHIASGYSAGYYSYVWSKVYAQDLFTAFAAGGVENPVIGMRYRKDILEPARTYEPDVLVQNFLGRPVSSAAFVNEFAQPPATAGAGR